MAKTLDLSVLPAKVTITNISKEVVESFDEITADMSSIKQDPGSTKPGAQDMQEAIRETVVPAQSTELQMFGINLFSTLEPGDETILKVETSKELFYWNLIKEKMEKVLSVTIEEWI